MSSKKHVEEVEEEETAPFWVISFSDMMTLLLAFFIMLFSMSTLEVKKMEDVVESMGNQFGGKGKGGVPPKGTLSLGRLGSAPGPGITNVVPRIDQNEQLVRGGIIQFDPGAYQLSESNKESLQLLYTQLKGSTFKIMIRGHASAEETGIYRDIDDLAYTRAWNVRENLISLGLDRKLFVLSQVGTYEPLDSKVSAPKIDSDKQHAYVEVLQLSDTIEKSKQDN